MNNKKIEYLNYNLSEDTPLYGNGSGIEFKPEKEIAKGDSCNTLILTFPNHSGTHIDFPCHFKPNGETNNDYSPDFWEFENVDLIDFSNKVEDNQLIGPDIFLDNQNENTELLLIRTGYHLHRGTDRYTLTPPGLSPDLASFLRLKYPKLRCIGLDIISISSYGNREAGREAHHAFLNPKNGQPILLIEDMKLEGKGPYDKVIVAPLMIDKADGAPCTVLAYKGDQ